MPRLLISPRFRFFYTFLSMGFVLLALSTLVPCPAAGKTDYDVVVIGAGGGGLAAGARLARAGMSVLLIEQHSKVGGYMSEFYRGDYTFEVSLHGMDGLDSGGLHATLLDRLGIVDAIAPVRLDPMYHAVYPDFELTVPADISAYLQRLTAQFPEESEGLERLFADMDRIYRAMLYLVRLQEGQFSQALELFNAYDFQLLLAYRNATLSDLLDDYVQDEQLLAVLTQLVSYGGNAPDRISAPFFAFFWNSFHRGGFYYFEGGSQSVSNALADVITAHGGDILLSTAAEKISIKNGRAVAVVTDEGLRYTCRYVVSNVNAPDTYETLIGYEYLPARFAGRLKTFTIGISWFQVYLGVDHDYSSAFPDGTHEIAVNPGYDQNEHFNAFAAGRPEEIPFYIMNYTLADTGTAPQGKSVIVLSTCMPYNWKNDWYEFEDYEKYRQLKHEVADILIKRAEGVLPGLAEHVEVIEVGSPRTMEHYTRNPGGAILGWENTPDQVLFNRLPQQTPIPNVLLAGAWTFPCGGQSAVLESGRLAAEKILVRECVPFQKVQGRESSPAR